MGKKDLPNNKCHEIPCEIKRELSNEWLHTVVTVIN